VIRVRKAVAEDNQELHEEEGNTDEQTNEDQTNHESSTSLTRTHYLFGGYLHQQWHSQNKFIRDPKAFIYSLSDEVPKKEPEVQEDPKAKGKKPAKGASETEEAKEKELGKKYAALVPEQAGLGRASQGPSFGKDLYISQFSNQNRHSCAMLGMVYGDNDSSIGDDHMRALAGSKYFVVDEIEIFTAVKSKEGDDSENAVDVAE